MSGEQWWYQVEDSNLCDGPHATEADAEAALRVALAEDYDDQENLAGTVFACPLYSWSDYVTERSIRDWLDYLAADHRHEDNRAIERIPKKLLQHAASVLIALLEPYPPDWMHESQTHERRVVLSPEEMARLRAEVGP